MPNEIATINQPLDRTAAGSLRVIGSPTGGGINFTSMGEVMEFAKLMSVAAGAVPPWLRGNAGACMAVTIQAVEWGMTPFAVANKTYFVNDRIAYESQLIHALIEARAPLERRLKVAYTGEGQERQCIISGIFRGEDEAREVVSPKLKDIKPQNSPLWKSDPDQQLFYYTSRTWARRYCPDVILGIYAPDEVQEMPADPDRGTGLVERLQSKSLDGEPVVHAEGFNRDHVDREIPAKNLDAKQPAQDAAAAKAKADAYEKEQAHLLELQRREKEEFDADQVRWQAQGHAEQGADGTKGPDQQENAQAGPRTEQGHVVDGEIMPNNEAEYFIYARSWFATCRNATEAHDRWKSPAEKRLRKQCRVSGAGLETLLDELTKTEFRG